VRQLVGDDGTVLLARAYSPYGQVVDENGMGGSGYGFTGEQFDVDTGLVFLRARWYAPGTGRFLSIDQWPGDEYRPMSLHLYIYVWNSPVRYRDPTGHYPGGPQFDPRGGGGGDSCLDDPYAPGCQGRYHDLSSPVEIMTRYPYDEAAGLDEAHIWLVCHPNYDIFADPDAWGVNSGELVPRNPDLQQLYVLWRGARGEQALLAAQVKAQATAWAVGRKHVLLSRELPSAGLDTWGAAVEVGMWGTLQVGQAAAAVVLGEIWHPATFASPEDSAQYHYNKHGKPWKNIENYTQAARQFYVNNQSLAKPHRLRTGEMGVKITTENYYGIYTIDGRIISFGER